MTRTALILLLVAAGASLGAQTTTLAVIPAGAKSPINFECNSSNIIATSTGDMVMGDVELVTPLGNIPLLGASLFFGFAPGTSQIQTLRGQAYVPSPFVSAHSAIDNPAMAEVGMDFGRNIKLGVPLDPDRSYLFFHFNAGLNMHVSATGDPNDDKGFTLGVAAGVAATEILDPADPFYYIAGGLVTPEKDKGGKAVNQPNSSASNAIEAAGVGESIQGLIPFVPATTYGIEPHAVPFSGNSILSGSMQVPDLPLAVDGYEITGVAPQTKPTFYSMDPVPGLSPWTQMGINGDLSLAYKFLKLANLGKIATFSFHLGSASAAVQTVNSARQAYFSGILQPDLSWIPDWMPFKPVDAQHAYGYISTQLSDLELHTDGIYSVDASELGKLTKVPIGNIFESNGSMTINQDGYRETGETSESLGPLGASDRQTEVWVPFEGFNNAYLRTSGLLRLGNALLVQGTATVAAATGFTIKGNLASTPLTIAVSANIGPAANGTLMVDGTMSVPPQFQTGFDTAIESAAATAQASVAQQYDAYQQATKNYQFELSLEGTRTLIPPLCDAVNKGIDDGIAQAFSQWPSAFGLDLPGKAQALSDANNQAAPYKKRMDTLKAAVQQTDNDVTRAALKAALEDVLNQPPLTVSVAVLGTIYNKKDLLTSSQKAMLRKAVNAVDALPAASSAQISAQKIWDAAPKQDVLQTVAAAIQSGAAAAPHIADIGFDQPLFASPFVVFADVVNNGKTTRISLPFDPSRPEKLGDMVGVQFSSALSTQPLQSPPAGASGPLPVITPGGVVNGAGYNATITPGSWVTIYGTNLAPDRRTWRADEIHDGLLPTQLDGVSVTIDGKAAAVYFISSGQVDALAPADAATGAVQLWLTTKAGSSVPVFVDLEPESPAFFALNGASGMAFALATNTAFQVIGDQPVKPGDVLILWGTGFGGTNPPTPSGTLASQAGVLTVTPGVTIGGVAAEYLSGAIAPGLAGVYQIAVRVPDVPDGDREVVAASNGMLSPPNVYLNVRH